MKLIKAVAVSAILLAVTACGDNPRDRAISGGGIGAGAGALTSAVTGGSPLTGAVVGGAVGAAAGGFTKKEDVNLGKPSWK